MYAYHDSTDRVIATSLVELTLAEAQAINPDVDHIVAGAPIELKIKQPAALTRVTGDGYFHTHDSGDGTDIGHYSESVDADQLTLRKNDRHGEVEGRTYEIVEVALFEHPASSGNYFVLTTRNQNNWMALYTLRAYLDYTPPDEQEISCADKSRYSFADEADLVTFTLTALGAAQAVVATGKSIHDAINAATTPEAVAAVSDPR